jgi:hypothetical protein
VCGAGCAASRYFDGSDLPSRLRQDLADQSFSEAAMEAEPIKKAAPSGEVIVVDLTGSGQIRIYGAAPPLLVSAVLKALR